MSPRAARSLALASALLAGACGGAPSQPERAPAARSFAIGGLRIAAEGPCSHLAVHAIGDRRVLVFGDTGYDLAGWLPGDEIPAAQSIAVLTPDGAGRDPALLRGLPTDARGYVPGHLVVGGHAAHDAWLLRVTTRYAPGGGGALFARASEGYRLGERGWRVTAGSPVDRPPSTRGLPELPTGACGEGHTWIPLASATTRGGVLVAGRCDDPRVANPSEASILVAHGRPGATAWEVARIPGTSNLDGIVNVDLAARADDDAVLVAWEPFVPLERRQPYAARWDGRRWAVLAIDRQGGYLGVAQRPDGTVVVVDGAGAHRVAADGTTTPIVLPPLRFARGGAPGDLYVRGVHALGDELWIEASYRVWPARERPAVWGSAVFTDAAVPRTVYCDAREPADRAIAEVE